MRHFLPLFIVTPLLAGCTSNERPLIISEGRESINYSDFADIKLKWENLFSPAKSQYFVYIYSISCGHCENIKPIVLDYIDNEKDWFYILEYSSDIPISTNVKGTIGKRDVSQVSILGTPTLLQVTNKYVSLNIAGEKDILQFLEYLPHNC